MTQFLYETSPFWFNLPRFFEFCKERHAIYLARQRGEPYPWTDDPILQEYKFTNVYRELDTGTIWCREHLREPYAEHPELFFNIAAYRRYNWWPAAEVIGWIDDYPKQQADIVKRLYAYIKEGGHVFTGAHMLNCQPGVDKITHVFKMVLPELWTWRRDVTHNTFYPEDGKLIKREYIEKWFKRLMKINGFGPFLSYEVVSDLRWTRYLNTASDIMTWANPGPGAQRGIQRLLGLSIKHDKFKKYPNRLEYIEIMQNILYESKSELPGWMPAWEMREVEHSLCEFDKYERARLGQGRPRSKYTP